MGNLKMKEPGINPLPQWQTCVVVAYDVACKKQCFPFPTGLKVRVRNLKELLEKSQMNETRGELGRGFSGESSKNKRTAAPSHF